MDGDIGLDANQLAYYNLELKTAVKCQWNSHLPTQANLCTYDI